jgi:hypothetical protein
VQNTTQRCAADFQGLFEQPLTRMQQHICLTKRYLGAQQSNGN